MPLISVLTPAHAASAPYLSQTAASVLDQTLPTGWELEWIVQADNGSAGAVYDALPLDARISFGDNGPVRLGAGPTRNVALARARGDWVQPLDADDLLLPGALAHIVDTSAAAPEVHWLFSQANDLLPDHTQRSYRPRLAPMGFIPAGHFTAWMDAHGGQIPVPATAVSYRTTTLRALGGWGALPIGEDIILLAVVTALTDGWQSPQTTWLYRQHGGQVSREPNFAVWSSQARQATTQRIAALRNAAAGPTDDPARTTSQG